MQCDEVQSLYDPYLDSELDAKTTAEIQQHLLACARCAGVFAAQAKWDAQARTSLTRGRQTAALWERIEKQVAVAARPATQTTCSTPCAQPAGWWRELFWPCPQAWAGLAALWIVMLAANFATPKPTSTLEARRVTAVSPQMRQILKEQKQMLAELGGVTEQLEARQPGAVVPQPRSDRRKTLVNT